MDGELALAMGGVKISKAVYGAGDQSGDFTDVLQKALDSDPYLPIVANNTIIGDPAQGTVKSVRVTYAWHGKSTDIEIGEETAGVLPVIPETGLKIRGASKRFRIIAIRWGWGAQSRDVTAVLAPLLQDPTKPFTPSADDVAPDPASGIHKWLVVWFDNHGRCFARLCRDDAWPITLLPAN